MPGIGDLVAHLEMDTSGFIAPVEEAASVAEASGERIIRVVHEQQGSWLQLATATVPAIATVTSAVAGYLVATATIAHQRAIVASVTSGWSSAGTVLLRYAGIANTVAKTVIPQWRVAGMVVGGAILLYRLATSEMGQSALKAIGSNGQVAASYQRLTEAASKTGAALSRPFEGLRDTAGFAIQGLVENFSPLPMIASGIGSAVAYGMDLAVGAIDAVNTAVTVTTDGFTALALSAASGDFSGNQTAAFYAEAASLRTLAAETERVMTLQRSHQNQYQMLRDAQLDAAEAAGKAEEITTIGHLNTAQAIDAERTRYQQLFASQIQALGAGEKLTSGQQSHIKNVMNALANQSAGVGSGRITEKTIADKDAQDAATGPASHAAQSYASATDGLNRLKYGQDEAARMAIMASDATDEEVIALLALHDQTVKLAEAQKEQKKSEQLFSQGAERIESMRDQVDLLSGAATAAEVEMRKLTRAGYSQEQIDEMGQLQGKIDGLKGKDKPNKAMFSGSAETASLILRGVGGGGKDSKEKIALDQYTALKQIAANTKGAKGGQTLLAGSIKGY